MSSPKLSMSLKVPVKLLKTLPKDLIDHSLPFLDQQQSDIRARIITRVRTRNTATDSKREWPLPPYSKATRSWRKRTGKGSRVDYTRKGEVLDSIAGRLSRDAKSGGLRLTIAPRGRHSPPPTPERNPGEAKPNNPAVAAQTGNVREAGGYYWRKPYSYTRVRRVQRYRSGRRKQLQDVWRIKPEARDKYAGMSARSKKVDAADLIDINPSRRIEVPGHWVRMPPIDIGDDVNIKTSRSGWWWYLYYRQQARERMGIGPSKTKRSTDRNPVVMGLLNKDIANYLGKRLGNGRWAQGWSSRPNPFIQPAPRDMEQLRKRLEAHVLKLQAAGLFKRGGEEFDVAT